jgi:hypothetical protein
MQWTMSKEFSHNTIPKSQTLQYAWHREWPKVSSPVTKMDTTFVVPFFIT